MGFRNCYLLPLLCAGLLACAQRTDIEDLPKLPTVQLSDQMLPPVREQILKAQQVVSENPLDALANGKLAMVLATYGFVEAADTAYQRASLLAPKNFQWAYFRGHLLASQGRQEDAITQIKTALKINPNQKDAKVKLAELLVPQDREQSRSLYKSVLQQAPNDLAALYGYASLLQEDGNVDEAKQLLRQALEQNSEVGEIHALLGNVYRATGEVNLATAHIKLATRFRQITLANYDPVTMTLIHLNHSDTRYLKLAEFHFENLRYDQAIETLRKALKVNPENANAHIHLIWLYTNKENFEKASEHYRHAIQISPNDPLLLFNWAVANRRLGDIKTAKHALNKAQSLQPENVKIYVELGRIAMDETKWLDATRQFETAIDIDANRVDARYLLGQALMHDKNYAQARTQFDALIALETAGQPVYMRTLAQLEEITGNHTQAEKTLALALTQTKKSANRNLQWHIEADLERLTLRRRHGN